VIDSHFNSSFLRSSGNTEFWTKIRVAAMQVCQISQRTLYPCDLKDCWDGLYLTARNERGKSYAVDSKGDICFLCGMLMETTGPGKKKTYQKRLKELSPQVRP
jgi:hypothetical protein